jgi:hypothetical protein
LPWEGRARRDKFVLDSYNYHTFGAWEFNDRRRVGYLGDVAYLRNKYGDCLDDSYEEDVNGDDDAPYDLTVANQDLQPPNLTKEKVMEIAFAERKLD